MNLELKTQIEIKATPEAVWSTLTDFSEYSKWNPFIRMIKGDVRVGNQIKVGLIKMTFKPKVLVFEKNQEFRWLGHLFFKGLFDGEHYFKISKGEEGSCLFEHGERFKGFLIPFMKRMLLGETKDGFNEMNRALKERVEKL